jgi:hypothetical protein
MLRMLSERRDAERDGNAMRARVAQEAYLEPGNFD